MSDLSWRSKLQMLSVESDDIMSICVSGSVQSVFKVHSKETCEYTEYTQQKPVIGRQWLAEE